MVTPAKPRTDAQLLKLARDLRPFCEQLLVSIELFEQRVVLAAQVEKFERRKGDLLAEIERLEAQRQALKGSPYG